MKQGLDDMYLEFLLNYVYEKKPLCRSYSTWLMHSFLYKEDDQCMSIPISVVSMPLNKKGIEKS